MKYKKTVHFPRIIIHCYFRKAGILSSSWGSAVSSGLFFENSDFVYMLNQAGGDRQILAKQLGISTHQLSYVTHSGEGEGLLFYGSTILPFVDHFPKNTELYRIMTTKPQELKKKEDE